MFRRVGTLVLTLRITQYSKFNRQEIIIPWTQTLLVEIVRTFSKALKQTAVVAKDQVPIQKNPHYLHLENITLKMTVFQNLTIKIHTF